jgi:hypothetical protein
VLMPVDWAFAQFGAKNRGNQNMERRLAFPIVSLAIILGAALLLSHARAHFSLLDSENKSEETPRNLRRRHILRKYNRRSQTAC